MTAVCGVMGVERHRARGVLPIGLHRRRRQQELIEKPPTAAADGGEEVDPFSWFYDI